MGLDRVVGCGSDSLVVPGRVRGLNVFLNQFSFVPGMGLRTRVVAAPAIVNYLFSDSESAGENLRPGQRLRFENDDLSGKTNTTTTRMSGAMAIATGSKGVLKISRRTKGTSRMVSGMNAMKTMASLHSFAFNHHQQPETTQKYPQMKIPIPSTTSSA